MRNLQLFENQTPLNESKISQWESATSLKWVEKKKKNNYQPSNKTTKVVSLRSALTRRNCGSENLGVGELQNNGSCYCE